MPCCVEQDCISAADLAEADPAQIGAALGAIARRPLRRMRMHEIEEMAGSGHAGSMASVASTRPNLAL